MVKPESASMLCLTKARSTNDSIQTTNRPYKDFSNTASDHRWQDALWLQRRKQVVISESPLAIYRLDPLDWLASWQGVGEGKTLNWKTLDWKSLGTRLIPHLADMGFTHMELTRTGPSRAGFHDSIDNDGIDGAAFAHFVDTCHASDLGVIVEIQVLQDVLSNIVSEKTDASTNYPRSDSPWLSGIFNTIQRYHLDGVSLPEDMDDSSSLALVEGLAQIKSDVLLIANAFLYTSWLNTSLQQRLPRASRLLVHNAIWSRVMLAFLSEPAVSRSRHYPALVDSFSNACEAPYLLALANPGAHHPWLARIPGDRWQRFATLRSAVCLMWAHPGKKLLGMGTEFAQDRSRQSGQSLDWTLLDDASHAGMLRLVADIDRLYGNESALHGCDSDLKTVEWVINDDTTNNVVAFLRHGAEGTAPILVVANFTPQVHQGYRLGVPSMGAWYEVINSDSTFYGGSNVGNGHAVSARMAARHGYPASLELTLPPLGTLLLKQGDWPA